MLPYGPYLNLNHLKAIRRTIGSQRGRGLMSAHSFHHETSRLGMNAHYVDSHDVPWKTHPPGSYECDSPQYDLESFPYLSEASVEVPLSAESISVLSEGSGSGGGVIYICEDDNEGSQSDTIQVDIKMYYTLPKSSKLIKISYSASSDGQHGVRLVNSQTAPVQWDSKDRKTFMIKVKLPRASATAMITAPNLKTHLPNFMHLVDDLANKVHFGSISLSSANAAIFVKSLSASRAKLRTSNAQIEGHFTIHNYLSLRTSNDEIHSTTRLLNDGMSTSYMELITSNDSIESEMSLESTTPQTSGGSFKVSAHTSNADADITCISAPVNSTSHFEVKTSNASATLRLPPTFEGNFELHSTPYKPSIDIRRKVEDPAGEDRKRVVSYSRERRGLLSGTTGWLSESGKMTNARGSAVVKTSNDQTRLIL